MTLYKNVLIDLENYRAVAVSSPVTSRRPTARLTYTPSLCQAEQNENLNSIMVFTNIENCLK